MQSKWALRAFTEASLAALKKPPVFPLSVFPLSCQRGCQCCSRSCRTKRGFSQTHTSTSWAGDVPACGQALLLWCSLSCWLCCGFVLSVRRTSGVDVMHTEVKYKMCRETDKQTQTNGFYKPAHSPNSAACSLSSEINWTHVPQSFFMLGDIFQFTLSDWPKQSFQDL